MKTRFFMPLASLLSLSAPAQSIWFNFDIASVYTPLPINLTVGGMTAHFTATGGGYSIQNVTTATVVPVGFSGSFIFPSSVFASDLLISFSAPITDFSILYAPQELACDSSATMRVTAFMNSTLIGSATTNAQAGTWPAETLRFSSTQIFNNVVVHYDKPPVTGGDYGPVFLADNMAVTPASPAIILSQATMLANGNFQFTFTNTPSTSFTVFYSTNMSLSFTNWYLLGSAVELSAGTYQFTDLQTINRSKCFYRVRSP